MDPRCRQHTVCGSSSYPTELRVELGLRIRDALDRPHGSVTAAGAKLLTEGNGHVGGIRAARISRRTVSQSATMLVRPSCLLAQTVVVALFRTNVSLHNGCAPDRLCWYQRTRRSFVFNLGSTYDTLVPLWRNRFVTAVCQHRVA